MIIGYYEQSYFDGGYYCKITQKDNETKYKIETISSEVPNYVPCADKYIKKYETIDFKNEYVDIAKEIKNKLKIKYVSNNILIDKLIKYISSINLDKLANHTYQDDDIYDGNNWRLYIEIFDKKYFIEGYQIQPKEVQEIYNQLHKIVERYIKNSFNGILGFAIGDAMGVPLEFVQREKLMNNPVTEMLGYGSHNVPKGTWSDDTSMTLATIDSIINTGTIDYTDIANNFLRWFKDAKYTATNEVFGIGRTTLHALANFEQDKSNPTDCGENSEMSNGNGSLMRMLPIAYYCYKQIQNNQINNEKVLKIVKGVSSITHAHEISILGCYIYTMYAIRLLNGDEKYNSYEYIKNLDYSMFSKDSLSRYDRILKNDISKLDINEIKSSGYIVDTLEATLWVLLNTSNYNQAIIGAINLGNDTDTIGACTGGLAGIIYGEDSINSNWKNSLLKIEYIQDLCDKFDDKLEEIINNPEECNNNPK